jgi:hypothetical protein
MMIYRGTINLFFLSFLFFISCAQSKIEQKEAKYIKPDDELKVYLDDFEEAVEDHDWNKVMGLIHPDYVKEQHDEFLDGRTDQFLKEFFNASRNRIKKVDFIVCYKWRNVLWTDFWVIQEDGIKNKVMWSLKSREDDSAYKYGLVGAVG